MSDINLKEKLHHYIDIADEKKLAAIYTLVEEDIATEMLELELEKRLADFETNPTDTLSFEQLVNGAREQYQHKQVFK
jgi:hypothetical protein